VKVTACGALIQEEPSREKVEICSLVIEVTRRCNMECDHCLRGDAENLDIRKEYIENLLKGCSHINGVTFTGGEPTLNPEAIEDFIKIVTRQNINVGYFYIATNGKVVSERMFLACARLYALCYEKEMCQIVLSDDQFHHDQQTHNGEIFQAFRFFTQRGSQKWSAQWINQGRYAEYYGDGRENKTYPFQVDEQFISDSEIYLNCEGNVIAGCDWSYKSQRDPENVVCSAGDDLLRSVLEWNKRHEDR
jgi:hypothetical protein